MPKPAQSNYLLKPMTDHTNLRKLLGAALVLLITCTTQLVAQVKPFQGTVQFKVTFSGKKIESLPKTEGVEEVYKPNNGLDLVLKDGDFIVQMYGGSKEKTLLYINDSNWTYIIDIPNEQVYKLEPHRLRLKEVPSAMPTGKTETVLGVVCQEYKLDKPATKKYEASTTYLYVSDNHRADMKYFQDKDISQAYFTVKGLEGRIPLKIVYTEQDLRIETVAVKILNLSLKSSEFRLPPKWPILLWDNRR